MSIYHNVALLIEPTKSPWNISWRAGNMFLNRFHIDEDAAFESAGIYNLWDGYGINYSKGKDIFNNFWLTKFLVECSLLICRRHLLFYSQGYLLHDAFDYAFQQAADNKTGVSKLHFVYAGIHFNLSDALFSSKDRMTQILEENLLRRMEKHQIKSATMTTISMMIKNLVTLEEMEKYYLGDRLGDRERLSKRSPWKRKSNSQLQSSQESFQDDLDLFFENFRLDKFVYTFKMFTFTNTHFIPKITEEEGVLVKKDTVCLKNFFLVVPDVAKYKMKQSKSDSKFLVCDCDRRFFVITL